MKTINQLQNYETFQYKTNNSKIIEKYQKQLEMLLEIDWKNIVLWKASDIITKEQYVKQMLEKTKLEKGNIIVPSEESLQKKYFNSIIAINIRTKDIIWNISIDPFTSSYQIFKWIKINSTGTLFIVKEYRWKGVWWKLMEIWTKYAKKISDIILSLTFNPKVYNKRLKLWFKEISPILVYKENSPIFNEYLEKAMKLFVNPNNDTAPTIDIFLKNIKFLVRIREEILDNQDIKNILKSINYQY